MRRLMRMGECRDSKSIAGICWLLDHLAETIAYPAFGLGLPVV